ncbi:hypothetical protein BP5796_06816 [Coleophoma crateriformis]|uniref:Zn(2)-C6 fungal-type domain-containing protein n=1 Tax=Coleophoma crateriformis TaxID=565419 RepID=A0A3D8RPR5_9HELO|nr:hypothetical protein BP5796_06816 [Coleophoma crateriformis]
MSMASSWLVFLPDQEQPDMTDPAATTIPEPPSQSRSPPDAKSHAPHNLNIRSCTTCRRRKVKCDKKDPCTNCSKAGSQCVFPAPGRAPRRPRIGAKPVSDREAELLKRLHRLEGVVEELSGQVDNGDTKPSPSSAGSSGAPRDMDVDGKPNSVRVVGMDEGRTKQDWIKRAFALGTGPPKPAFDLEKNFGRLVVDEGKSEYINDPFWASLTDEVAEIREILDEVYDSDNDPVPILPSDAITDADHQSFIMGYSSAEVNLRQLHPLPSQIPFYWETFLENVNPLVKIVHAGTMNKVIKEVQNNLDSLSKSTEALMFAIYFATVTSMTADEVQVNFGIDKTTLSKRYRFGVEQALARAQFLNTNEIVTVQAFILFLVCVRRHDDTRFVWTMTGLAIRIAQSIGLHRDGSKFGLSPFDTEMRRRLWWQIIILDTRASEDHGSEPTIMEHGYDTNLPLSINDEDLDPDASEPPKPRPGVSEMTFCLIRYEICRLSRRLMYMAPGTGGNPTTPLELSVDEKEQIVKDCAAHMETTYLQYCENAGPLYWVAATVARLIVAKMSLVIYHPFVHPGRPNSLSQDVKDRLFMASIEIIEYSRILESEASTKQWGWLFHTYVQWHAIAYILGELCVRSKSTIVDRAWNVVDGIFRDWKGVVSQSKRTGMLWLPMRKLMAKAMRKREEDMLLEDHDPTQPGMDQKYIRPPPQGLPEDSADCPSMMGPDGISSQSIYQVIRSTLPDVDLSSGNNNMMESQSLGMEIPAPDQLQLQQQQFNQSDPPWSMDDGGLLDLNMDTSEVNWEGWDDLVKDFHLEADQQTSHGNPTLGGFGQWW